MQAIWLPTFSTGQLETLISRLLSMVTPSPNSLRPNKERARQLDKILEKEGTLLPRTV